MRVITPINIDYNGPRELVWPLCQRARVLAGHLRATLGLLPHGAASFNYPDGVYIKVIYHFGQYKAIIDAPFSVGVELHEEEDATFFDTSIWILHFPTPVDFTDPDNHPGFYASRCDLDLTVVREVRFFPWYTHRASFWYLVGGRFTPPVQTFTYGKGRLLWLEYERISAYDGISDNMRVSVRGLADGVSIVYDHIAGRSFNIDTDDPAEYYTYEARMAYQGLGPVGLTCNAEYIGVISRDFGTTEDFYTNQIIVDLWTWEGEFIKRVEPDSMQYHISGSADVYTPTSSPTGRIGWGEGGGGSTGSSESAPAAYIPPIYGRILRVELVRDKLYCWTRERTSEYHFTDKNQLMSVDYEGGIEWIRPQIGSWTTLDQEGNATSDYAIMSQSYNADYAQSADMGLWYPDGEFWHNVNLGEGVSGYPGTSADAIQACGALGDTVYLACGFQAPSTVNNYSNPTDLRVYKLNDSDPENPVFEFSHKSGILPEHHRVFALLLDRTLV